MARRYDDTRISACPVAEGVRFRYGTATAFAVRQENKDIALRIRRERHPFRAALARLPFTRGMVRFVRALADLMDGISESSEMKPQRIAKGTRFEQRFAELFRAHPENLVALGSAFLIPVLLAGLIWALPLAAEKLVLPNFVLTRAQINAVVCAVRIVGLLISLLLCARLRVVNRLCMYQGAINKVLNAWMSGHRNPDQATAAAASRIFRASDAAFVTTVLVLSVIAFALVRTFTLPIQLLMRVLAILAIAGVVNEPIRALERLRPGQPMAWLLAPYLLLERMFVIEPHDQMVEVALCAFNAARENDE